MFGANNLKMKILYPFLISLIAIFAISCASEKKEETKSNDDIEKLASEEAKESHRSGYASIDELSKEVVSSIKNNDYEDYLSHVMTAEMEETVSEEITNMEMKDHFMGEFGFSLDREEEEFNNLINYLNQREISLDSIDFNEVEVIDYHHDEYAPLHLKEVIITIPHDYDVLLIYVAIKIKDRWFLTSDLEV